MGSKAESFFSKKKSMTLELLSDLRLEMQNPQLMDAQLELKESNKRYFEIFELFSLSVLILDEEYNILAANAFAKKLLDVKHLQLYSVDFLQFIHNNFRINFDKMIKKLLNASDKKNDKN